MIKKEDLEGWAYYLGNCRNANIAMWIPDEEHFIHFRTKFGSTFAETIKHPEDDEVWDVFKPYKKVDMDFGKEREASRAAEKEQK